jgi:hypothetical protein
MNKTSIITQLNRQDTDRLRYYRELLDFYHGRQWPGRDRRGEKRLTFNYTKVFVDKITSYLMSGISFVVEAEEDSAEAKTKARRDGAGPKAGGNLLRRAQRPGRGGGGGL